MDLVEKIKTITYTACAAILTIVASICIFKLSNRACKVMDNFNGAIEGRFDENGQPYGVLPILQHVTKMVDDSKPVPGTIGGNVLEISSYGAQGLKAFKEVIDRVDKYSILKGVRMTSEDAEKAQKEQEEKAQKAAKKGSKK